MSGSTNPSADVLFEHSVMQGANVLVDATVGVQGVDGVVEHLLSAFEQLCSSGPLCAERLRGVRIDLVDAKIHGEAAQRRRKFWPCTGKPLNGGQKKRVRTPVFGDGGQGPMGRRRWGPRGYA